jgi:hypothetical protein
MPDRMMRLARFRQAHPEIDIDQHGGVWYAAVPLSDDEARAYDESSGHLHEEDLTVLLDRLDAYVARPGLTS